MISFKFFMHVFLYWFAWFRGDLKTICCFRTIYIRILFFLRIMRTTIQYLSEYLIFHSNLRLNYFAYLLMISRMWYFLSRSILNLSFDLRNNLNKKGNLFTNFRTYSNTDVLDVDFFNKSKRLNFSFLFYTLIFFADSL